MMRGSLAMGGFPLTSIAGHRALVCGPTVSQTPSLPPIVLLGGTAQWIDSWTGHLTALARKRRVLLYESRGQGGGLATPGTRQCDDMDVGLRQHADDFWDVVRASDIGDVEAFDVCAFSFGARVAMCAAATSEADAAAASSELPRLRRMCLTGVSADRGPLGRLALESWRQSLSADDLAGFAWRLILDTYSDGTLGAQEAKVDGIVRNVVRANSVAGLRAIVENTHTEDPQEATHPLSMAQTIAARNRVGSVLLINGGEDRLSAPGGGAALADAAGWRYVELPGAGHAAPLEKPVEWRREVCRFLDDP